MNDCIFCKIINGDIPCSKVYDDEFVLGFKDINPEAPAHIVIIPKKHIGSLNEISEEDSGLIGHIFIAAKNIAESLGIDKSGYRIVTNCGKDAGQSVQHLHFHLLGGREMKWPPG